MESARPARFGKPLPEPEESDDGGAPVPAVGDDSGEPIQAVLQRIPIEQRAAIVEVVQQQLSHSGPLPAPAQLREYEEVLPGLAERIVRLTEGEQEHRHEVVSFAVRRAARLRDRGQWFGLVGLILTLAFCVYLVITDHATTAGIVTVGLVVGVVSVFVTGRKADAAAAAIDDDEGDEG